MSFLPNPLNQSSHQTQEQNPILDCLEIWNLFYKYSERKIRSIYYLLNGADEIHRVYLKANGSPFEIPTPGRRHLMVTSPKHIEEINRAPLDLLSLHAVAKDFLQPKDTMHGFEWKDIRGVEGTGFVRALRGTVVPLYELCKRLVARLNCHVFFGSKISEDIEFFEAAYQFPQDSALAAEFIRLLPKGISRLLACCVTKNFKAAATLHHRLGQEIERRLEAKEKEGEKSIPNDCLQWIIDTVPKKAAWSVNRFVGEVMGIWYGSVHTLSIAVTYALLDLYTHPEYIEPLREELSKAKTEDFNNGPALPLLDSFLSESARLSAFESTGVRRQALNSFTFRDGLRINRGDWICVPHRSMMRDNSNFIDALTFDGFRFLKNGRSARDSHMVDASDKWLIWGIGRITCPGRFYATATLKLVIARFLKGYDCELLPFKGGRSMQWRSTIVPKRGLRLAVRRRTG
ncbi:cytochrome P450 [Lentithecium fluviatile CBS 122367]|uniref:Cytochrome P450 n=1 Tax=Lentithecium fluviatile CBS 122367 TaxID=1168545 RepID=A0A6G1ILS6_9PLEO|nr:cytochrome P450 [Lentithecium fluviatile CBS 122367]